MKPRFDSKGNVLQEGESQRKSDGWYIYRWRSEQLDKNGKKKVHTIYSKDLASLRAKEQEIKRDNLDGIDVGKAHELTLNEWNESVMKVKRFTIKANTDYSYTQLWHLYVENSIGTCKLCEIKKKNLELFYLSLLKSGKAPGTIKRVHSLISSALEEAVDDDILRKNYAHGAFKSIPKEAAEKTPVTATQADELINFCKDNECYYHVYPMLTFMLETGLRVSELCGLTWSDINTVIDKDSQEKKHTLTVSRQLQYKCYPGQDKWTFHIVEGTKTESGNRSFSLSELAIKALEDQRKYYLKMNITCNATVDGISHFIFLSDRGTPLNPDKVNKRLGSVEKAYNKYETARAEKEEREPVLLPHLSAHVLRHSNITIMSIKKVPIKVIQRRVGHKNPQITDGYDHSEKDADYERSEMQRIGSICG